MNLRDLPVQPQPRILCGCTGHKEKVEEAPVAEIIMLGYTESDLELCPDCALQLARKLLEDLCVFTPGGRHG